MEPFSASFPTTRTRRSTDTSPGTHTPMYVARLLDVRRRTRRGAHTSSQGAISLKTHRASHRQFQHHVPLQRKYKDRRRYPGRRVQSGLNTNVSSPYLHGPLELPLLPRLHWRKTHTRNRLVLRLHCRTILIRCRLILLRLWQPPPN